MWPTSAARSQPSSDRADTSAVTSPQVTSRLGVSAAADDDANRILLVVAVCNLAAGVFVTFSIIGLLAAGGVTEEIVAGLLGSVCALTLAVMARLGANINLVGNTLLTIGCTFMGLSNFVAGNSEIFGAAFIWYLTVPVVATFLFGRRHGTVWTILVAAQIVMFLVLMEADLYRTAEAASVRVRFLAVVAALGFIHLVMSYFERSRSSSHDLLTARVHELETVNEDLRESRDQAKAASKAKSQFLATVSHEIRTPLNGVIGMAGVLGTTELDDEQDRFVSTIETSGNDLLRIIDDILDLARIEDGRMTIHGRTFSLVDCVEDALEQMAVQASRKGLELGYLIPTDIGDSFVGDRARLQQVLVNLISNAVKFTPTGSVRVAVEAQTGGDDETALLSFRVIDTGIGIPAASFPHLFQPFSQVDGSATRKYGGTGLGLIIAKQLITRMGGTIRVESIEGKGSTFTFSTVVGIGESETPDDPALQHEPTLVLYGTEVAGELMCSHLRRLGADPTPVAVERLSNGTIDVDDYGLIVTDDPSVATRLAEHPASVVLVGDVHHEYPAEADGVVTRPIRTRRLRNVILEATAKTAATEDPAEIEANTESDAEQAGQATQSTPWPLGPPRILVAEDSKMNQTVVDRMLRSIGLEATVVNNGAEAVEAVRREQFDVVLMDLRMPVLGGIEATRQIREESIDRPYIIAVTANTTLRSPTDYVPLGIDDYLMKPVRPHQLAAAIDGYYQRTARRTDPAAAVAHREPQHITSPG